MIDALAPSRSGSWRSGAVDVRRTSIRVPSGEPAAAIDARRSGGLLQVVHTLEATDLSDTVAVQIASELAAHSLDDFEHVLVGLVRSTVDDPIAAWTTYYRNSLRDLASNRAPLAPVHDMAERLVTGQRVVDLGSCFGFFALRLAAAGRSVTATDICAGNMKLLTTVASDMGIALHTEVCDAAAVPVPDRAADTVTALHLLEHVPPANTTEIITEALRIAKRRVVIAVPFENEPTRCHGHLRTFDMDSLAALGTATGHPFRVFEHHGGWLVLDKF